MNSPRVQPYRPSFSPSPLADSSVFEQGSPSPRVENRSTNQIADRSLIIAPNSSDAWIHLLREELLGIGGVESMYMARDGNTIDVWVIIPRRDLSCVRMVAEAERSVMRSFVSRQGEPPFFFDFHTIYRGSHNHSELVPLRAIQLPRL